MNIHCCATLIPIPKFHDFFFYIRYQKYDTVSKIQRNPGKWIYCVHYLLYVTTKYFVQQIVIADSPIHNKSYQANIWNVPLFWGIVYFKRIYFIRTDILLGELISMQ